MERAAAKQALADVLKHAYSGELAAALAYVGHARSVRLPQEKEEIRQIELDERRHRTRVGEMIVELGSTIQSWRELQMFLIGTFVAISCRIGAWLPGGWFFGMYGAGRLESKNIKEYEHAARYALLAGYPHFIDDLLEMAEVEWKHEKYFHDKIRLHALYRIIPAWKNPPPQAEIRATFAAFKADPALALL